ncbi:MAG: XTP/dITP diphosphatase [Candidatus Lokiarchaeota archaeon]|nr:XTP/dITP diphosphatase [Candidatus Lokiarchaeota archaeon]
MINTTLFFLTGNSHKFKEVESFIHSSGLEVTVLQKNLPLIEIQSYSLKDVAIHKIDSVSSELKENYFVEDSGFFIDHLKNFPGVFSSYVQEMIGNAGVLKLMEGIQNRLSWFRSIIALMYNGHIYTFMGEVEGIVSYAIRGAQGFGYDPIFIPKGFKKTFAEISMDHKNRLSHRIQALQKMVDFLSLK